MQSTLHSKHTSLSIMCF